MKNKLSGMKSPSALLRRIQPIVVWLLAVVLIGLGGCEKDRFAELEKEPGDALSLPRFKSLNDPETCESCEASGKPYQTLDDFPALRARILTQLQAAESESRYYAGILDGSVISSVYGDTTTYTIFWQTVGNTIYKLLVRTNSAGDVVEMGVLRIAPSPSFLSGYFQNTALLKDFEGEIGVVTVSDFLDAKRSGSFKSLGRNKSAIDDCQTLIFVNGGPIGGNGGNDGTNGNPGDTGTPGNGPVDNPRTDLPGGPYNGGPNYPVGGSGGDCGYVFVACGCVQHVGGYNGGANGCKCHNLPNILMFAPCELNNTLRGRATLPGLEPQAQRDKGTPHRAKNMWWDCVDLLNGAGLLTDHDLYLLRLRECDRYMAGFEGDVNDGATSEHPDADFCSVWKPYYDRCLSQLPANETQNRWAALMRRNRAAFNQLIQSDNGCTGDARIRLVYEELVPELQLTEEEAEYLLFEENGALANRINNLLEEHDGEAPQKAAKTIIRISMAQEGAISAAVIDDLITETDNFFDDPTENGEELYDFLIENEINPLAISPEQLAIPDNEMPPSPPASWMPYTPGAMWSLSNPIRVELENNYPQSITRIRNFFPCRILGKGFESASLESLGIPHYDIPLGGTGNGKKPDGLKQQRIYDMNGFSQVSFEQPIIVEVKGFFKTNSNVFDYSRNMSQFTSYLNYLSDHAYRSQETAIHALYLVLPGGVTVDPSLVAQASSQNVPLYISNATQSSGDPGTMRLSRPQWLNAGSINTSGHVFNWMGNWIFTKAFHQRYFRYDSVSLTDHLNTAAGEFEQSYLENPGTPECDTEDEVYED